MYPICLNIRGRLCVVIGGGRVAERKVRGLLVAAARIRVVSPKLTSALAALVEQQIIEWRQKLYDRQDIDSALLVFAATNNRGVQATVCRDARAAGVLVNLADAPEQCDFQVPATVRRGDLTLAVATNGRSPAVAAMVRRQLERSFGEEYGLLTRLAAQLRNQQLAAGGNTEATKILFQKIFDADIVEWLRERQWERVRTHLEQVLGHPIGFDLETLTKDNP